ncbi:MAG: dUTP diphosphatase [Chitinophagales bacterium]|jgi:dUTP pyrophosphatase|nr:dUTP diphosphatase [Sphingobacteriales bacterium]
MNVEVKIINQSKHALPAYETLGSAGMDLRANIEEVINLQPFERMAVPTGLFIELPQGFEAQIRPRSGLSLKSGLSIPNSPGTIDSDYRGEIKVIVANLSNDLVEIKDGDRIAQMVIAKYERAEWNVATNLDETERGSGGFGSTGI